MSLSTTDIYRLNHMNTAASKVDGGSGLGTFLSQLEGVTEIDDDAIDSTQSVRIFAADSLTAAFFNKALATDSLTATRINDAFVDDSLNAAFLQDKVNADAMTTTAWSNMANAGCISATADGRASIADDFFDATTANAKVEDDALDSSFCEAKFDADSFTTTALSNAIPDDAITSAVTEAKFATNSITTTLLGDAVAADAITSAICENKINADALTETACDNAIQDGAINAWKLKTPVAATIVNDPGVANREITLTALETGTGGNSVELALLDMGVDSIAVSGTVITVEYDGPGAGDLTTAKDIVDAINGHPIANRLVSGAYDGTGLSTTVTALAQTALTGGVDGGADEAKFSGQIGKADMADSCLSPHHASALDGAELGQPLIVYVDTSGAGNTDIELPVKIQVLDFWAVNTSAGGGGGDTIQLFKAAGNAITNALDMSGADEVIARASTLDNGEWEVDADSYLRITVTDGGGGVPDMRACVTLVRVA